MLCVRYVRIYDGQVCTSWYDAVYRWEFWWLKAGNCLQVTEWLTVTIPTRPATSSQRRIPEARHTPLNSLKVIRYCMLACRSDFAFICLGSGAAQSSDCHHQWLSVRETACDIRHTHELGYIYCLIMYIRHGELAEVSLDQPSRRMVVLYEGGGLQKPANAEYTIHGDSAHIDLGISSFWLVKQVIVWGDANRNHWLDRRSSLVIID